MSQDSVRWTRPFQVAGILSQLRDTLMTLNKCRNVPQNIEIHERLTNLRLGSTSGLRILFREQFNFDLRPPRLPQPSGLRP